MKAIRLLGWGRFVFIELCFRGKEATRLCLNYLIFCKLSDKRQMLSFPPFLINPNLQASCKYAAAAHSQLLIPNRWCVLQTSHQNKRKAYFPTLQHFWGLFSVNKKHVKEFNVCFILGQLEKINAVPHLDSICHWAYLGYDFICLEGGKATNFCHQTQLFGVRSVISYRIETWKIWNSHFPFLLPHWAHWVYSCA